MSGGLDELFARLRAQQHPGMPTQQQQPGDGYQPASVSSPMMSPPSHTPNPIHSSNIISPVNPSSSRATPAPDSNQTANLLNLLTFKNNGSNSNQTPGPMENLQNVGRSASTHMQSGRAPSSRASDYTASIRREASASGVGTGARSERPGAGATPNTNSTFLLDLLQKPNAASSTSPAPSGNAKAAPSNTGDAEVDNLAKTFAQTSLPAREPALYDGAASSNPVVEAPQPTKAAMFNYVNPFDQLHSSSPLNRSPKPPAAQPDSKKIEILKHDRTISSAQNDDPSAPAAKQRKLELSSLEPTTTEKNQSVSEALEEAGERVDKEVEKALADATAKEKSSNGDIAQSVTKGEEEDDTVIKKEKVDDEVESSWESAEEEAERDALYPVEVFNFPMKPFVQIQIKGDRTPPSIRQQDGDLIRISNAKKDFDQIDRCLASATQSHIVYAQSAGKKSNKLGLRIIRQDTGAHKQIFHHENERIFNVQLCSSADAASDVETVLGTGVNGSVFWTSLAKSGSEVFAEDDIEKQGFIMAPIQTAEEVATGSPVKTRAKMSSRHPEYFAIARGKQIHIISPETVMEKRYINQKSRKMISDKYHKEHSLRIMTGKAGKDFCFSEDDTMIVSLDKSGRFKFWDIRELVARAGDYSEEKHDPVDLTEPIWSLNAAASGSRADEKPSVSSIMFLDKDRPVTKGIALRYMLIGFKQNHILQLWDLGLGKAVQEIRLPHEKDSDGICSISYHPKTGILAVGHPTRNSIYFIHLSAPKYNVPSMDQARYASCLARGDQSIPRPDSTAIMSGVREFSFSKVGQLRSVDMLKTPIANGSDSDTDEAVLFELYIMHSKGVVGVSVKRKDLGWDKDSKIVRPVDALKAGVIEVVDLIQPQKLPPPSEPSSNADVPARPASKSTPKKQEAAKSSAAAAAKNEPAKRDTSAAANGTSRAQQTPGSKQVPEAPAPSEQSPANPPLITADSYSMAAQRSKSPARDQAAQDATSAGKRATASPEISALAPHISSADDFQAMLTKQFDSLYQRIDADKRVQDAAGAAKQDAMLRLVSSTLTENVEKTLTRIINGSVEKEVIPHLEKSAAHVLDKKLEATLPTHLNTSLTREIKAALPAAVQKALQDSSVSRAISDQIVPKVEQQVSGSLKQMLPGMLSAATNKLKTELERRQVQQLNDAEFRRQQDQAKIQELTALVRGLSETVQQMSQNQTVFQEQMLKMQQEMGSRKASDAAPATEEVVKAESKDEEIETITRSLQAGQYDAATMQWLQSPNQARLFDAIFVRVNPRYLEHLTPLVALSVSAAITATFGTNVDARLDWLEIVLTNVDLADEEIRDVAPRIMDVLSQRLQGAYMAIAEEDPQAMSLRRISGLNRRVQEVRRLAG